MSRRIYGYRKTEEVFYFLKEYSLEGVEGDPVVMTGSSLFPGSGDPMRSPRSEVLFTVQNRRTKTE